MKQVTVYAIHDVCPEHMEKVEDQSKTLGAPTIKVVDCGDHYMALEGSHRLAVAAKLGMTPKFVVYQQDDLVDVTKFDWFEPENWNYERAECKAGEVAGELWSVNSPVFKFEIES